MSDDVTRQVAEGQRTIPPRIEIPLIIIDKTEEDQMDEDGVLILSNNEQDLKENPRVPENKMKSDRCALGKEKSRNICHTITKKENSPLSKLYRDETGENKSSKSRPTAQKGLPDGQTNGSICNVSKSIKNGSPTKNICQLCKDGWKTTLNTTTFLKEIERQNSIESQLSVAISLEEDEKIREKMRSAQSSVQTAWIVFALGSGLVGSFLYQLASHPQQENDLFFIMT